MKKILITGGAGYIGSMLATQLVYQNYDVTVLDVLKYNKNSLSHLFFFKNFKLINGDVRNSNIIKSLVSKNDYIIPLAALVGAPLCDKYKSEAISTNLGSIKILLKYISKKKKIIFLTSNSGYGIGEKNKYCDENSPIRPISLYGRTKCEAEKLVNEFQNSVCFRLATVFGYSYRMRSDLLVNNFVSTALNKNKLEIFEPHFRRNYIHVRDVVEGILFTIKNFSKLKSNIFNLGLSSANLTKLMLAKAIKKNHPKMKIKIILNKKDLDKRDYYVSNKKIESYGFKAKITLNQGIKELINYFENNSEKIVNNY